MSLALDSPAVMDRFDALCRTVAARGKGLTLPQLGTAHALARELGQEEPDPTRVGELAERLELSAEDLGESVAK